MVENYWSADHTTVLLLLLRDQRVDTGAQSTKLIHGHLFEHDDLQIVGVTHGYIGCSL